MAFNVYGVALRGWSIAGLSRSWFVYARFLTFQGFMGIRLLAKQILKKNVHHSELRMQCKSGQEYFVLGMPFSFLGLNF